MRNLFLTISFDGTAYHGWQVQNNAVTVQETLQDALEQICSNRDNVVGCSRTDAGVHANMYCCNIRTQSAIPCEKLVGALNALLPRDIAALSCEEVDWDFHARYDCKSKEYIYKIWNSPNKNPFLFGYSLHHKYLLDVEMLDRQAKDFIGTHDFSSFCAAGSSVEDTVRTVMNASVEREGDMITFRVEADGFLYNMVRIMVGTLIDIARGKIPQNSIPQIIEARNRFAAGQTAPAHGLYLNNIHY
ncbi:MAG: tRNA pseudouridine(38-40) synthase TruA [Clostridia bacterium]|nr:tRNA pseudouridine(38-40) synthase TruA [Clostridia bacterium]